MNSQTITKRSAASSSHREYDSSNNAATIVSIPSTNNQIGGKRVKRVRRKPKQKSNNFLIPLGLGITATLLVVVLLKQLLPSSNNTTISDPYVYDHQDDHHNNNIHAAHEKDHGKRLKVNDLNAENDPIKPKGFFSNKIAMVGKYKHSDFLDSIGDHSTQYTELRREYDALLPMDDSTSLDRIKDFVKAQKVNTYHSIMAHDMPYDIHNCPSNPPPNYPYQWNVKDVLENWPPDDTFHIRKQIYQGLCIFDYETEFDKAMNYREAEVPFIVQNDPKVMRTVERWNQPGYMQKMLGHTYYRTEFSKNNHFMYWTHPKKKARKDGLVPEDWKPPTKMMRMPYKEWLEHANVTDEELLQPDHDHWYYRLIGCGEMGDCDKDSSEYLFDELPFFQPTKDNPLYMVEPKKQKGIHCRFGMKGVIAENHFDGSRNMIAILGGERRYILSHPNQCENLALYQKGHPSARHSAVDWSNPDWEAFPEFAHAEVNEVVMQAGDIMYLPTNWFHYIISLGLNFQCNTRSGVNHEYMTDIHHCGF